jgi:hypothetical protein
MSLCCLHCGDQRAHADDVDDTLDIVGEHMQGYLGGDMFQCLHLEVCVTHPGFDGSEGMFDRLTALVKERPVDQRVGR